MSCRRFLWITACALLVWLSACAPPGAPANPAALPASAETNSSLIGGYEGDATSVDEATVAEAPACQNLTTQSSPDLTVTDFEVTQGVAGGTLVGGKETAAILHLQSTRPNSIALTGVLLVCYNGDMLASVTAKYPVTADSGVASEIVFEPFHVNSSPDVELWVTIAPVGSPEQILLRSIVPYDASAVVNTVGPLLLYTRIDFQPSGRGAPDDYKVGPGNGDAFAHAVLPVAEVNWAYGRPGVNEIFVDAGECDDQDCNIKIDSDSQLSQHEGNVLLKRLETLRNSLFFGDVGVNELIFLHGWVEDPDGDVVIGNGAATGTDRRVGYGSTRPSKGQLIYAHELLHNIGEPFLSGFGHSTTVSPVTSASGWDVNSHLPGDWIDAGISPEDQRKTDYYPIMAHHDTAISWIAPDELSWLVTYLSSDRLMELRSHNQCEEMPAEEQVGRPCFSAGNLVLSGVLSADGGAPFDMERTDQVEVVARFPAERIRWPSQPTYTYSNVSYENTPFRLVFYDRENGEPFTRTPFDARTYTFPDTDGGESAPSVFLGFFGVVVPPFIAGRAERIEIEFRDQTIGEFSIESILEPRVLEPIFR